MSIDPSRGAIDEARRSARAQDRLTPAGKPGQAKEWPAQSPSQKSVDQSRSPARNVSRGPKEDAKEGTQGISLLPAWLRRLGDYGLALLFVATAALLRWALSDVLTPAPSLVFYLAWVGAASFGGLGPGLVATLASWLCIDLLFDPTPGQIGLGDPMSIARLWIFLAGGLVVSIVGEERRRSRIRERRQGRELAELAQSLDREKRILQSLMNGAKNSHLVYLDRDFNFVHVNEAYARTCGYASEEMIGKNHFVLYPHAENEAIFARVRDTGVPVEFHDKPFVFPDQPERGVTYWDWTLTPIKSGSLAVEGLVLSLFETTQRKRAQEAVAESRKRYRGLVEKINDWVWEIDVNGVYTYSSPRALELLGYPPEEIVGKTPFDFMPATEVQRVWNAFQPIWLQKKPLELLENTLVRKDGSLVTVETSGMPVFAEDGAFLGYTGIDRDVTSRKRAEEALRSSQSMLTLVMENVPQGIFWKDRHSTYLGCNKVFAKAAGLESAGEIVGKTDHDLPWSPEQAASFREYDRRIMENDTPAYHIIEQQREVNGKLAWLETNKVPLHDAQGHVIGILGTYEVITERKRAEEALRGLNATLESRVAERTAELEHRARQLQKLTLELTEAEERERKRLAEILHDDLQQVLAAAKFQVGLLSSRVKNDAESQEIAGHARNLLIDAIAKSRSLSHELSAALSQSNLCEAFEWLAQQMQTKHGFTVHLDMCERIELASEPLRVLLYKAAQESLFNVIKHAGVHEAKLRLRHQHGRIWLSVSDEGRGFDPTQPGYNLGFGLRSIRERVGYLGGRMKIRSAVGKGSTFLITMPDSGVRAGE